MIRLEVLYLPSCNDLICKSVSEYWEARILAGQYRAGEKLPSILEIAAAFHLAPETVRAALLLLAQGGYIRMEAKLGSWVTYQADPAKRQSGNARFYAQRRDGIHDLLRCGPYLLEPLLTQAVRQMDGGCRERLRELWTNPQEESIVPTSIRFYSQILAALNNSLVLNLYWEIARYVRFSFLPDWDARKAAAPFLPESSREEAAEQAKSALRTAAEGSRLRLLAACSEAGAQYPQEEQIPFCWTVYRQRHQLCYTLAARIIRMAAAGLYPVGSYLPSLPNMAKQLDVSLRTLRRTLSILGSLGVTRSFHGKGTLVCMAVERIEFSRPEIKEGLRYYWESLQFLSLTAGPVTLHMLRSIPEEDRADLTGRFVEMCELDRCHRCFDVVLDFIAERCPLRMARECYKTLGEYLAWGYPFTLYRLRNHSLQAEYAQVIRRAADLLIRRDWEGFAGAFGALMLREAKRAEMILTDYCK